MGSFSILAIATIVDDKNTVIGYRLLNTDGQQAECKNIPKQSLINALANKSIDVENLAVVSGESVKNDLMIVGTQGSIERLPTVKLTGELVGNKTKKSPLTIVNKLEDVGYTVADYKGAIKFMRVDEVVAYSKEFGITNGKVVTRNGVEFISAINGAYKEGKLKRVNRAKIQAKDVVENGDMAIRKNLTKAENLKGIVRTADLKVSEEIEYNDTFRLLNEEQRKAIRSYYAWWTVKTFESLAGSRKLEVTPKKAAELAKLKRNVTWSYKESIRASVYCKDGYDYCTLGHKLKTVHFAIGVDNNTGEVETIKFGSTCIADFFDISVEGVRKLDKVAGIMSEEIELMTNIARENAWDNAWKQVGLISDIVDRINNEEVCRELFGEKVGEFLVLFKKVGLAYPASMVKMAREYANEKFSTEKFWKKVYESNADYLNALDIVFKSGNRHRASSMYGIINTALEHLYTVMLEGAYSYDPIKKVGDRGKGRFTKEAAYRRKLLNSSLKSRLGIVQYNLEEVDRILYLFSSLCRITEHFKLIVERYTGTRDFKESLEDERYSLQRRINQYNENIIRECKDFVIAIRSKKLTQSDYIITDEIKAACYIHQLILKVLKSFMDSDRDLYYSYDKMTSNLTCLIPGDEFTHSIVESITIYKSCIEKEACEKMYEKYLKEAVDKELEKYRLNRQRELEEERQQAERLKQLKAEMEQKEQERLENNKKDIEDEDLIKDNNEESNVHEKLYELLYSNDKSDGAVCLNESCTYNHEGNCQIMMALGKVHDCIKISDDNLVNKCELTSDIKLRYNEATIKLVSDKSSEESKVEDDEETTYNVSTGKKLSDLDALDRLRLLNRDGIYDVGIEDSSATYIAKDIISRNRYDNINSLSYKQKAIIEKELNRLETILKGVNLKYDYANECFMVFIAHKYKVIDSFKLYFKERYKKANTAKKDKHKMGDISDGENRTYSLTEHKDMQDKLEKVIEAVDNDGIELDSKTVSIVKTVLMRAKFSDKQYKYIKQALDSLAGE